MNLIADIIGGLVTVGMKIYQTAQMNEAEALRALGEALSASVLRVDAALAKLEEAREAADRQIADGFLGGGR